jgi:hypothetical protein
LDLSFKPLGVEEETFSALADEIDDPELDAILLRRAAS